MGVAEVIFDIFRFIFAIVWGYVSAFFAAIIPPSRKSIEGEIVLITGAGHGIGREFALEIAKLGATVVVWDVNRENNEKTAEDIKKAGGKAHAYTCDITSSSRIANVAEKVRSEVGDVTILINNAGIANVGPFLELSEADIRRTFEVNTLSHFWMNKEFLPAMIKKGKGHILNVISMAAFSGAVMLTDYCASKHGAYGFHQALTEELYKNGHHGIKLTALCPMFVDTGLLRDFSIKRGRVLTPRETALAGIDGMLRNYEVVTVPSLMHLSVRFGHVVPRKTAQYIMRTSGIEINSQYKKQS